MDSKNNTPEKTEFEKAQAVFNKAFEKDRQNRSTNFDLKYRALCDEFGIELRPRIVLDETGASCQLYQQFTR